jgi:hypothetical protein
MQWRATIVRKTRNVLEILSETLKGKNQLENLREDLE